MDDDNNEKEDNAAEDSSKAFWYDKAGAPIGGWRTSLCSCCDVLTQSTFWMGLCCTPILMAQLITRLKLTWNGQAEAHPEENALSYNRIVVSLLMVTMTLWKIPFVGGLPLLVFYIVVVVYFGSHVRAHMRQ